MSVPYARTVITGNEARAAGGPRPPNGDLEPAGRAGRPAAAGRRPVLLAGLGAACISASAILVKLADTGSVTVVFYRCFLALPVLAALAVAERRRRGPRRLAAHLGAVLAGVFLTVDLVLWNHVIADVGAGVATVLAVSSLLLLLQPAAAMLLAAAVLGERPSVLQLAGAACVCCGVLGASLAATAQPRA